jgi:hypothetical protein
VTRKLIVRGGDFRRRTGASIVVVTRCILQLRSTTFVDPCEKAFIQFEKILRDRKDHEIKYEWENIYRQGIRVTFNVNWYDQIFFEDRKNAYLVGPHAFAFQRFGAVADDFKVRHQVVNRTTTAATRNG